MATERLIPLSADLTETNQVLAAADKSLEALGGQVDILVNNAAWIASGVKAEHETYEIIRRTLTLNLEAPIQLAQKFVPGMIEVGSGSIINISSIVAHAGIGRMPQATYASTKGAIGSITREWAAQGYLAGQDGRIRN